jgi:hypothetical protein
MKLTESRVIIGIHTCPDHRARANSVRRTWQRLLQKNHRLLFVYGRPGEPALLEGDSLYVDCPEAYEALPQKTHGFLEYCQRHFKFDYLFKTDDDSYVDLDRFASFDTEGADYIGQFRDEPLGEIGLTWHYGKCTDKSLEVPSEHDFKCGWATGGGYFLSPKAVDRALRNTIATRYKNLFEDKMIGEALTLEQDLKLMKVTLADFGLLNPLLPKDMSYVHNMVLERRILLKQIGSLQSRLDDLYGASDDGS